MERIDTREQLRNLAARLQVRADWHEPDERGLSARVEGLSFDNAGFWPTADALRSAVLSARSVEMHVIISQDHGVTDGHGCDECGRGDTEDVAAINLATLLAWAAGLDG